jgi:CBS domain-containing protein
VLEANPAAFALLALRRVEGGVEPALGDLFADSAAYERFRQALGETGEIRNRTERLRGAGGELDASLSAVVLRDQQGKASGCEVVVEGLGAPLGEGPARERSTGDLQALLPSLHEPVARFLGPLPSCELGTRIAAAATLMARQQASALLVVGPDGEGLGLVTDADFRARVVARGLSGDRPIREVMSAPLVEIAAGLPGYLAVLLMREKHVRHVVVRDEAGRIQGVVRDQELLELERYPLALLARAVSAAGRLDEVLEERARLPALVGALVDAGAKPRTVTGAIAAVTDAVTQKLVALACEELGPAPVPFAFVALGSQGRGEQTLASDQDNALVFDAPAGAGSEAARAYFLALGERVCGWLARAGYSLCKGGAMASNPRFCLPLPEWKELFSGWITTAEPKDLLEFNIFFDLRCVHGQAELVGQLRGHIAAELARNPNFFVHLAQNALQQKPLLGFFGNIVAEPDDRGSSKSFSIKEALTPIVSFARLYALRAAMAETNTFERLRRLGQSGVLSPSLHGEVALAYDLLMSLRLRHQAEAARAGLPLGNQIAIKSLTRIEEIMLKEVFAQVTALQKRIAADFLGGAWVQSG